MPRIFFVSQIDFFSIYFRLNISQFFLRHHYRTKGTSPTTMVLRRLEACAVLRIHAIGGRL